VIEAVLERMDLKLAPMTKSPRTPGPTPGHHQHVRMSLAGMTKDLPLVYRRRFFGTHFFNPPR